METVRRRSKKREALWQALCQAKDHPSAEMLYARLKGAYPELSLGTVYRNLSEFRARGEAACVATVAGQERLDARRDPHAHFVCRRCGRVLDVELAGPCDGLSPEVPGAVEEVALTLYGICDHCR